MDQNNLNKTKTKKKNIKYGIAGFSISALFFALLILFLLLLSIILGVWALYLWGLGSDISNEIEETVVAIIQILGYAIGVGLFAAGMPVATGTAFAGFCFGITSIRHQPTKVMTVFSRIITYTLLIAVIVFLALTVYLWIFCGFYEVAIHYFFEIIESIT